MEEPVRLSQSLDHLVQVEKEHVDLHWRLNQQKRITKTSEASPKNSTSKSKLFDHTCKYNVLEELADAPAGLNFCLGPTRCRRNQQSSSLYLDWTKVLPSGYISQIVFIFTLAYGYYGEDIWDAFGGKFGFWSDPKSFIS